MENIKESKNSSVIPKIVAVALVVLLLGVVVWLLTNKKETITNSDNKTPNYSSLECKADGLAEGYKPTIELDPAEKSEYTIKALFDDDSLGEISYEFRGEYPSDQAAESAEAWFRTRYYRYMDSIGVNAESINPVFINTGKNLKLSLYAERKKFTSSIAPTFLIDREEYGTLSEMSPEALKKLYEKKGFSCTVRK